MKLRELVNKIDNDIILFIIGGTDAEVLFKRKYASDVIPENLLNMEVGSVFNEFNSLYICIYTYKEILGRVALENCLTIYMVTNISTCTSLTVMARKEMCILVELYFAPIINMPII